MEPLILLRITPVCFRCGKNFCEVSKAGPVVDTSTKFFARAEIFRLEICLRSLYSELLRIGCQVPRELMSRARCNCLAREAEEQDNMATRSQADLVITRRNRAVQSRCERALQSFSNKIHSYDHWRTSMLRNLNLRVMCAITALTILSLVCITCGGGSSQSNHNLSQAQAQDISSQLFASLNSAVAAGLTPHVANGGVAPRSLGEIVEGARPDALTGCTIVNNVDTCDIKINYQGPCPQGGTINVAGDFMFTLDSSGNGSDSSSLTVTPAACGVDNLTINGSPNVMFSTQFNLQNNALAFPITFSGMGGVTYGPNPSGNCSINVKGTASSATSCSVSGSICGRSVSGSC